MMVAVVPIVVGVLGTMPFVQWPKPGEETGGIWNQRKNQDYPNHATF